MIKLGLGLGLRVKVGVKIRVRVRVSMNASWHGEPVGKGDIYEDRVERKMREK